MYVSVLRHLAVSTLVTLSLSYSAGAIAACKGMAEAACTADGACTWVSGYARKDGIEVRGYCRNNASKASHAGSTLGDQVAVPRRPATGVAANHR